LVGASDLAHDLNDIESAAGGFATAIEIFADATGVGLFFIFHEEDLVNDRGRFVDSEFLKSVGNGGGNQVGVAGASADDAAQSDDAIRLFFLNESFANHRDFKGSGDPDEIDASVGRVEVDFFHGILDEGVGILLVELGCDNGDTDFCPGGDPWFGRDDGRHMCAS